MGEIARRAGVSRSTVSYALSGKRPVSEATRRRIQRVIDELDYKPDAAARALRLLREDLPFVGIGHTAGDHRMPWIDVDYAALIAGCVHHLADLGHRALALINRSPELVAAGYGPGLRAAEGFAAAVAERGLAGFAYPCGDDAAAGHAVVRRIRAEHPEVTAAVTLDEAALPGIQHALAEAGLPVPGGFSFAGVAARRWAEDFRPPLTAADVPAQQMGARAVELLVERIAAPPPARPAGLPAGQHRPGSPPRGAGRALTTPGRGSARTRSSCRWCRAGCPRPC
ncbi:substrate-binding domain-containing protein [Kitasatospora sp. NPDC006697]|uniref:substrate-binding domain-containing protein n=1 Tax=Kitasatospora sp. NPDC006697 TaxID=3364020 RepID=UPI0036A4A3DA